MLKKDFLINASIIPVLIFSLLFLNGIDSKRVEVKQQKKEIQTYYVSADITKEPEVIVDPVVYDGMTMDELAAKLEKSLNFALEGTGIYYAKYSIKYGVDPYMAVAITMYETGCWWESSCAKNRLVTQCNNVGGQVLAKKCPGSRFGMYDTLEEGIEGFIRNISVNYLSLGMVTPYDMQAKYAGGSTTWAPRVEVYINKVKNK